MTVFRVSPPHYAEDLSGAGAEKIGGRWNRVGSPVLYTAENISLALLEKIAHSNSKMLSWTYSITIIHIPENSDFQTIEVQSLPKNWTRLDYAEHTLELGRQWLESKKTLAMKVPSAVNSFEKNILLNPRHPNFGQVEILGIEEFHFDTRFG